MDRSPFTRLARLVTAPLRMKPSFIIPGETKCGTTTLYRCLERHPMVASCDVKEPENFIHFGGSGLFCRMHYPLRLGFRRIAGEASAEYLSKPNVPSSIKALLPDVKLVIMLRDPIRRALSDYNMMREAGRETESFDACIQRVLDWLEVESLARLVDTATKADEAPLRYVTKGCYARTLKPWLQSFSRDRMLFIRSEDFFSEPSDVLDKVRVFLGLGPVDFGEVPQLRKAGIKTEVDVDTLKQLRDFYQPWNKMLAELLGEEFCWKQEALL